MRVIERSEYYDELAGITLQNRVRGTLRFGLKWYPQIQAQQGVTDRLARNLPNEYSLIRNLLVPRTGLIASLILIGPQGVYAIYPSSARGVFRAKDDEWLSHSGGRFRATRPNLQALATATSEVLLQYFRDLGYGLPTVEPVLVFTDPAAHVDTVHPSTRIVLADAIEHFAGNLRGQPPIMDSEDVQLLVNALLHPPEPEAEPEPEPAPPAPRPTPTVGPATPQAGPFQLEEKKVPRRRGRARLQPRQRNLLLAMVVVEVCLLVAFVLLILYPSLLP
jgi:hypothetical protein